MIFFNFRTSIKPIIMKINKLLMFFLAILFVSCNNYYSIEDFPSVEKTDAHFHIYTAEGVSLEQAKKDNFKLFSVNVYHGDCEDVFVKTQNTKLLHS